MRFLRMFPASALHFAVRQATDEGDCPPGASRTRLCGRCLALNLMAGLEASWGVDLDWTVQCGILTSAGYLDLYLQILRAAGRHREWTSVDLASLEERLIEFIGWVALNDPRIVLERIEMEALAAGGAH